MASLIASTIIANSVMNVMKIPHAIVLTPYPLLMVFEFIPFNLLTYPGP